MFQYISISLKRSLSLILGRTFLRIISRHLCMLHVSSLRRLHSIIPIILDEKHKLWSCYFIQISRFPSNWFFHAFYYYYVTDRVICLCMCVPLLNLTHLTHFHENWYDLHATDSNIIFVLPNISVCLPRALLMCELTCASYRHWWDRPVVSVHINWGSLDEGSLLH
jgi:hypothetical protein